MNLAVKREDSFRRHTVGILVRGEEKLTLSVKLSVIAKKKSVRSVGIGPRAKRECLHVVEHRQFTDNVHESLLITVLRTMYQ